jgi:hypothetical protein
MAKATTKSSSFWRLAAAVLAFLVVAQWILFLAVLNGRQHDEDSTACTAPSGLQQQSAALTLPAAGNQKTTDLDGVAATIMLRAPKWFHRRYTAMLHNVLANVPPTWGLQIFYNADWLHKDVLPLHPGLQDLFSSKNPRILWTPLPKSMTRQKPKEIMKSNWLWESVIAENVLFFSGNGALCANSKQRIQDFFDYDYVGAPWYQHEGNGGDGSTHSFRHRSAMLQILKEAPPTTHNDSPDHVYFIKEMLKSAGNKYKLADRNTTMAFAGVLSESESESSAPLLLSGIQASLNWTTREALLGVCPELKMIFPSMHEPSCFGAHPNPEKCKASICALQDPPHGHGC